MKLTMAIAGLIAMSGAVAGKELTASIKVPKMDCDSCAVVVKRALGKTAGVKNTTIDVDKRMVMVVYEDSQVTPAQLQQTIEKTGFEVKAPAKAK